MQGVDKYSCFLSSNPDIFNLTAASKVRLFLQLRYLREDVLSSTCNYWSDSNFRLDQSPLEIYVIDWKSNRAN
jgi:hypothetical protein